MSAAAIEAYARDVNEQEAAKRKAEEELHAELAVLQEEEDTVTALLQAEEEAINQPTAAGAALEAATMQAAAEEDHNQQRAHQHIGSLDYSQRSAHSPKQPTIRPQTSTTDEELQEMVRRELAARAEARHDTVKQEIARLAEKRHHTNQQQQRTNKKTPCSGDLYDRLMHKATDRAADARKSSRVHARINLLQVHLLSTAH